MPININLSVKPVNIYAARQLLAIQACQGEQACYMPSYPRRAKGPSIYNTIYIFNTRKSEIKRYLKVLKENSLATINLYIGGKLYALYLDKEAALKVYTYQIVNTSYLLIIYRLIEDATNRLQVYYISLEGPISKRQRVYQKKDYLKTLSTMLYNALQYSPKQAIIQHICITSWLL